MNIDKIKKQIINSNKHNILIEFPTGVGKTKIALDRMGAILNPNVGTKILIVVPRIVLIQNWIDECKKWGYEYYLNFIEFTTYVSLHKKVDCYDMIIFDEVHHLSERCREVLVKFFARNVLMLSATVSRDLRNELKVLFPDLAVYYMSVKSAISDEILPNPKVILIPLVLDNSIVNHEIIKNKDKKDEIIIQYGERFLYNDKNKKIIIKCTQKQFYDNMSSTIEYYKRKMYYNQVFENQYLRKCGERLKWLSNEKTDIVRDILIKYQNERTLTFCNSIEQTEKLGKYCINSKNKESKNYLEDFNIGNIDHITACNMLDEGANLFNCKVGIYAALSSSNRIIVQRLGRLLRHESPIIIIPYYKDTRDEEIVEKMLIDYDPQLITFESI